MDESTQKTGGNEQNAREEIFSKAVRAGKRTYFFDVKATRRNDYYLTLTESKKKFNRDGKFFYEKHKIFLYKEDFDKFQDALKEAISFIESSSPELTESPEEQENISQEQSNSYTDVNFEDLGDSSEEDKE